MKVSQVILCVGICSAIGVFVVVGRETSNPDPSATHPAAPENDRKALATLAKYLEAAPANTLKAMNVDANRPDEAKWSVMLPYTSRVPDGLWIAQLITDSGGSHIAEEARHKLSENPSRAIEQIQQVLGELPDRYANERSRLLNFAIKLLPRLEDPSSLEALMLKELQRPQEYALPKSITLPQAVALNEYYRMVRDPAKLRLAYKAAIEAQNDPTIRSIIQRYPAPASIDISHEGSVRPEEEREPASPQAND
jgi:hypothetical protein